MGVVDTVTDPRRAISLAGRAAAATVRLYAGLLGRTADLIDASARLVSGEGTPPARTPRPRVTVVDVTARRRFRRTAPAAKAPPPPPRATAPRHVSAEPVLAATVAEPGAEEGAGAEVRVDEPWPGYGALGAPDVVDRLAVASDSELAVIQLYEQTHRRRRSVIAAVRQELRQRQANAT